MSSNNPNAQQAATAASCALSAATKSLRADAQYGAVSATQNRELSKLAVGHAIKITAQIFIRQNR